MVMGAAPFAMPVFRHSSGLRTSINVNVPLATALLAVSGESFAPPARASATTAKKMAIAPMKRIKDVIY
jgi:hypothetical protein